MMGRLTMAGLLLACAAISPTLAATRSTPLTVSTQYGQVRGSVEGDVASWKGIPFAAPPVGALRWRAPQPPARWSGVRETNAYSHDCMQKPFAGDAAPLGTPPDEDCLYLNIWRPAATGQKLPVILWIYGGGFVNGGSSPPTYTGANLARQGVMFVSFNYRVGRFGTFAHPALTKANADGGLLANYGYLDQIAALQWVRRNIAGFGGDPDNITLIGESAGGFSVHTLLTSPMTQGQVQRAIIMSGGDGGGIAPTTLASAEEVGATFGESKGVSRSDPQAVSRLRALSADQVTDGLNLALMGVARNTFSSPFPDGSIAVPPKNAYEKSAFTRVPVMVGATSADIGGNSGSMIAGATQIAALLAGKGVPVYLYRFSYVASSIGGSAGALHATDIPFFFDTQAIKYGAGTTQRDNQIGAAVARYVANFARSGDPNGGGLPVWPRFDQGRDQLMNFTADGTPVFQKDPVKAAP